MNDHSLPRSLGALLALMLIAACGQRSDEDRSAVARAGGSAAAQERVGANAPAAPNVPGLVGDTKPAAGERAEPMNDAAITASVKAMLAADPQLATLDIGVDTQAGVVTLTGRAPDPKTVGRALEVAANAKGVLRVENQLTAPGKS